MSQGPETITEPWQRVMEALERVERAGEAALVRLTDAEQTAGEIEAPAPAAPEADTTEIESLRAELIERDRTISELRREAARLAGLMDQALAQLDTVQEG